VKVLTDKRLSALADFVRLDKRICDVGTDHALLPCELILRGAERVFASDVRVGPLNTAKTTIDKYGIKGIELFLSDGLLQVPPCDDVIIAGMGGELIAQILIDCPFLNKDMRFILQPMTKHEVLRARLYQNGFEIIQEKAVTEGKRVYVILYAKYTGEKQTISLKDAFFGFSNHPAYIKHRMKQLDKLRRGNEELQRLYETVTWEELYDRS
jgi:tRNA (adenine22-N1)-methyltransferase